MYKIWLEKAKEDIKAITILLDDEDFPPAIVCFHCQQAAEKIFKAYLTCNNIAFLKTHDLTDLYSNYILPFNSSLNELFEPSTTLTDYSIKPRYPDFIFVYEKSDAIDAYNQLKKIIDTFELIGFKIL